MTIETKRKILISIQNLEHDIEELKRVRLELATAEFASASLSSGTGAKSYTRQSIGQLNEALKQMKIELQQYQSMLVGGSPYNVNTIATVYSW